MCGILDGAFIKGTVRLSLFPKVLYLAANKCSKILGEVYLSSGKGSWGTGPEAWAHCRQITEECRTDVRRVVCPCAASRSF